MNNTSDFDLRKVVAEFLDTTDLTDFREMAAEVAGVVPSRQLRAALAEALVGYIANVNQNRRNANPVLNGNGQQKQNRSVKVAGIAAMHRRMLRDLVHVGNSANKRLGDCTYEDLMFAAGERREIARLTAAKADRYEWLAKQLHAHSVDRVADLPPEVLADMEAVA